jgi:hypothetical protein
MLCARVRVDALRMIMLAECLVGGPRAGGQGQANVWCGMCASALMRVAQAPAQSECDNSGVSMANNACTNTATSSTLERPCWRPHQRTRCRQWHHTNQHFGGCARHCPTADAAATAAAAAAAPLSSGPAGGAGAPRTARRLQHPGQHLLVGCCSCPHVQRPLTCAAIPAQPRDAAGKHRCAVLFFWMRRTQPHSTHAAHLKCLL